MTLKECLRLVSGPSEKCSQCGTPPPYYRRWEAKLGPIDVSVAEVTPGEFQTLIVMRAVSPKGPYYNLTLSTEFTEHDWEIVLHEIGGVLSSLKIACREVSDSLANIDLTP